MKCKNCGNEIMDGAKFCPNCGAKTRKKPFYKKWWLWVIAVVIIGAAAVGSNSNFNPNDVSMQTATTDTKAIEKNETSNEPEKKENNVPMEYKSALNKAKTYSDMMHMSKKGIYKQLTSEYGEKFSKEAAQYAIDNLQADYKKNALEKAKLYQETLNMSPAAIKDQLTSEYGEQFTAEEALYAIEHLN